METLNLNNPALQTGTFYIAVWGCQMNVYDADRIRDLLRASGCVETSAVKDADIVVLITCAVRAKAEDKVFNQIHAWILRGEFDAHTIVALGGCVGSELAGDIVKMESSVNIVFGPRTTHRLPAMIREFRAAGTPVIDVDADALEKFDSLPDAGASGPSAFVTIMEGCSNKCSYCIVPYTRGEEESRPVESILAEVRGHLARGVKEIHLLGQNVNSYRGLDADGNITHFSSLLYELAAVGGIERLRFTTSNPMEFTDDVVQAIADLPIIADSIHIPVQSGSDRILKLMRRHYTGADYRTLAAKLRAVRPDIYISSDFIVGFPGETEEDFNETMRLVEDVRFDQSFSFVYSPRPGTPAAALDDPTPKEIKFERLYKLQQRLEELAAGYSLRMLGSTQRVIVEGLSRKDAKELKGRASNIRIVVFEGPLSLIGQMATVKITRVMAHTLKGELITARN